MRMYFKLGSTATKFDFGDVVNSTCGLDSTKPIRQKTRKMKNPMKRREGNNICIGSMVMVC